MPTGCRLYGVPEGLLLLGINLGTFFVYLGEYQMAEATAGRGGPQALQVWPVWES